MPHLAVIYSIVTWLLLGLAPSSAVTVPTLSSSVLEIEEEEESAANCAAENCSGQAAVCVSESEGKAFCAYKPLALITVKHLTDMPSLAGADANAAALSAAFDQAQRQDEHRPTQQHEFLHCLEFKHDDSILGEDTFLPDNELPLSPRAETHSHFKLVTTVQASEMARATIDQAAHRASEQAAATLQPSSAAQPSSSGSNIDIYERIHELDAETIAQILDLLKQEPVNKLDLRLSFMSNDSLFVLNADDLQQSIVDCLQGHAYNCFLAGRHYDAKASAELKERLKAASPAPTAANQANAANQASTANQASAANQASTANQTSTAANQVSTAALSVFENELQAPPAPESLELSTKDHLSTAPPASAAALSNTEIPSSAAISASAANPSSTVLVAGTGHDVATQLPAVVNNIMHMLSFYRRGCNGGAQESCTMIGNANGRIGVALMLNLFALKDPKIAVQYLEKGCQHGDPGACANLGIAQLNGIVGTPVPLEASISNLRESCQLALTSSSLVRDYDSNVSLGCLSLGKIALRGVNQNGGTRAPDLHEAYQELSLACNLYNVEGCELLHQLEDSLERAVLIKTQGST